MSNIGKHGNHAKGPRVNRITIACEFCGLEKSYLPGFLKIHPIKYCSKKCSSAAVSKKKMVECGFCEKVFYKRRAHIKPVNYCSVECSCASRKKANAKWRDPVQIKAYMKDYQAKNKDRLNEKALERANKNKDRRKEVQLKYRIAHKEVIRSIHIRRKRAKVKGDLTKKRWDEIKALFNNSCVCCGKAEPEIKVTMDHIIPLSKGGRHTETNVQPLCVGCNCRKGTSVVDYRIKTS